MSESFDAIVIGAGAAGLMCALTAGQRGRKVLLLDHRDKAGAKILISGGGRCNFTNLHCAPDGFCPANPHSASPRSPATRSPISSRWSSAIGIAYHEKTLGQLFCDGSARAIVAMLLAECAAGGVDVRLGHSVTEFRAAEHFRVETDKGSFTAPSLVLATGGLSIPKMGATGFAYDVARRFGLRVTETLPGLVPLTREPAGRSDSANLSGVSLDGGRIVRRAKLPRKHPVHASRPVRPGDPADLVLLAAGRSDRARSAAGARRRGVPEGAQTHAPEGRAEDRARARLPARLAQALAAHLPAGADGQHRRPHARRLRRTPQTLGGHARPARKATPRPR